MVELDKAMQIINGVLLRASEKQVKHNKKSKAYMSEKRKTNKNYGNHYTYKNGEKR